EIYLSGAFQCALDSLKQTISNRDNFYYGNSRNNPSNPPLWQKATSATIQILSQTLSILSQLNLDKVYLAAIWERVAAITSCVVDVQTNGPDALLSTIPDENFEISAFIQLRSLIIPQLAAAIMPDDVINEYMYHIFRASMISDL